MKDTPVWFTFCLAVALIITGCAVGPNYKEVSVETPATYASNDKGWKTATPQDEIAKGNWWEMYGDTQLNTFESQATELNQDLKSAVAQVEQSRALSRLAKAAFLPAITTYPSGSFFRNSANLAVPPPQTNGQYGSSDVSIPVDLSYELDLWGRVRRSNEAATANVQASLADFETVRLSIHAEVAETYFNLRELDAEAQILSQTVGSRKEGLDLIRASARDGFSSDLEVAQAENALATTQADLSGVARQRVLEEHALAVLLGKTPESVHVVSQPLVGLPPEVPVDTPSTLLERRPDVARMERLMAAANAQIGVAKAAFFPVVQLVGSGGFESVDLGSVFNWPSRFWAAGPSVSLPIFDGGKNAANLSGAEAAYVQTTANYREQVLVAFREVEDGLAGVHFLSEQAQAQGRAVDSAQRTFTLASKRFQGGRIGYLDVIDAQRVLLENQRQAAQLLGQQFVISVQLVKALGGGWKDSSLRLFEQASAN